MIRADYITGADLTAAVGHFVRLNALTFLLEVNTSPGTPSIGVLQAVYTAGGVQWGHVHESEQQLGVVMDPLAPFVVGSKITNDAFGRAVIQVNPAALLGICTHVSVDGNKTIQAQMFTLIGPPSSLSGGGGGGITERAFIYNLTSVGTIAVEGDIKFDTNGLITAGITHAPGSASILVGVTGVYEIQFSVSGVEPNQFAVFVNGAPAPGGIYGSGAGTQQNTGQLHVTLTAGDVVTLRNHTSAAAVTLQTLAGGTAANSNASIILKKIG
jgi:hypothetical protein